MDELLLEALSHQLEKEGACAFKHSGCYFNVFEDESDDDIYHFDKYEGMEDFEPFKSASCGTRNSTRAMLIAISN